MVEESMFNSFKKYKNLKLIYFLQSASLACIQPFISIYLRDQGLKPSIIGIITCLLPFLAFISTPLWTNLTDSFGIQKQIVISNCILSMIALLLLIPTGSNLIGIFLLISLYSIVSSPVGPIVDSLVLKELGKDSKLYGQQRLFGAISYGLVAFFTGIIIQHLNIYFIFIIYSFWMLVFLVFYIINQTKYFIISNKVEEITELSENGAERDNITLLKNNEFEEEKLTNKQVFINLLKNTQMMVFLFSIMICGMTYNIIANFLFLFLRDHLNASNFLLGSTMPFTVVMELPFFFFGKQMLEKVGITKMIIIGHSAFILRLCLYNIFAFDSISPWFILPIEILHGVAFATLWTAGVELSSLMAPKGYETTYQGIFNGIYSGLGSGIGSIIGGFLYEHKSPLFLFRFTSIIAFISASIFTFSQYYHTKKNKNPVTF